MVTYDSELQPGLQLVTDNPGEHPAPGAYLACRTIQLCASVSDSAYDAVED